jgi:hypothetical protein
MHAVYDHARARDALFKLFDAMATQVSPATDFPSGLPAPASNIVDSIIAVTGALHSYRTLPPPRASVYPSAMPMDARGIAVVHELLSLLEHRVCAVLSPEHVSMVASMLESDGPDILTLVQKQHDENAHSSVIAWLLNPRLAPNLAPAALGKLAERLHAPGLSAAMQAAVANDTVTVRREVIVPASRDTEPSGRLDIVVFGDDFMLGIENKVLSSEHSGQTNTYWEWMNRQPGIRVGIFLSLMGVTADCPSFQPLSYVQLLACLLSAPLSGQGMTAAERIILSGYCKSLGAFALKSEIRTALRARSRHVGTK